ncbi:hypothetical protein HPP92_005392 [Vanilla planifolia]|uniref:Aminotransferase class V domain-containing protein n=1 Tax=Vanilla planifolia TaxID=51239 RepID=A0A835RPL6_VANPL|nr:hypothetical protein HPP92_005392 [Vanilla planifolia]
MKLNKLFGIIGSVHVPSSLIAAQAGTDGGSPAEKRLEWLRSQLIGRDLQFDTCFGKRLLTYADHTASGRCLRYIEEYITQQVLPFYGNSHTSDSSCGEKTTRMVHEAREYIRRCVGACPEDALIFCGSGATAAIKRLQEVMGIAVPANLRSQVIENLREEERWVVFVGPFEHHSNLLSWRQSIAEVVEIGIDADGLVDMEALELQLASMKYSNRPKLGSFSACSNVTGIIADTRALSRLLHKYGAYACFDFATSGPYVEIDMRSREEEGYDAIFLSPHKFPGGPGSPGILVMHEALYKLRSFPPSTCGGGVVAYVNGFNAKDTVYYNDIEERERGGCAVFGPYGHRLLGVEESLSLHIRSLIEKGYNGLKPGWTRVSFAYYLTKEEFAFILDAIEFIASYGHRFLSLYHLDWMTGDWTINRRALGHHLSRKESLVWLKDGHRKKKSHSWFGSYMKDAQRIARSLPSILNPVCIPDGVDPNLVLFKI